MSLDILQTRGKISSSNIYFLQSVCVEITKRVIDNKDNLTNNDKFNAPGPSLNDKGKEYEESNSRLSSQFRCKLETADKSCSSSGPKLN